MSRSGGVSSYGNNTSSSAINPAPHVTSPSTTGTADRRKSGDFSISAILSEDSSRKAKVTPIRGLKQSASSGMLISPPGGPMIPMSTPSRYNPHLSTSHFTLTAATPTSHWAQTGALNQSVSLSPFSLLLASSPTGSDVGSSQGRLDMDTGDKLTNDSSLGMLSTVAMYHSGLSEGGGEGERREKEGGSKQREGVSSVPAAVGEGMAQMRLESSSDTADTTLSVDDRRSTPPPPCSPSSSTQTRSRGKGTTPFILKRDRKRRRQLTESFLPHTSSAEVTKSTNSELALKSSHTEHTAALDTGFLSPTSAQRSPRHTNLSFSPSIFLSRPTNTSTDRSLHMDTSLRHDSPSTTSTATHVTHGDRRDTSVADGTTESALGVSDKGCDKNQDQCSSVSMETHSSTVQLSSFATSTPIKKDKENTRTSGHVSPTYLSPSESSETKRPRLRSTTYDTSSGSDSEVPVKKCRSRSHALQHRSKARAQLSPLLENACSPIAKTEQRPPSSLLTANYPTSSASTLNPPPGVKEPLPKISVQDPQTPTTPHPPITMPYLPPHVPPVPFPFPCNHLPPHYPPQPNLCLGMMPVAPNPLFPMSVSPLSPPHTSYFIPPCPPAISPTTANLLHPSSLYYYNTVSRAYSYPAHTAAAAAAAAAGNVSQKWGGSPLSTQWEKTGQIQSVPPWFIFEQNRPEGKRLRLTEAINRSLSETPSHNPKLPAEWTKYACGQTDDQRLLTQKARQFLQSGRRQLTFDNINT